MGAWGPAVFSDDTACDVRNSYRERIADGMEGPAATDEMIGQWTSSLDPDDEEESVFWLALAATQWKVGRLEDRVRDMAIEVIDSGKDLGRWEEAGPKDLKKRQGVLQKLKDQLLGPQPAPKKVRVERPQVPPWSCGDYVAYRLPSDRLIILYVEAVFEQSVYCSLLDWVGAELPDDDTLRGLSKRTCGVTSTAFSLYTMKKRGIPYDRLTLLDIKNPDPQPHEGGGITWDWSSMDYQLEDHWNLT